MNILIMNYGSYRNILLYTTCTVATIQSINFVLSKVAAPQDAHRRFVLQVYLGSNSLECSAICR